MFLCIDDAITGSMIKPWYQHIWWRMGLPFVDIQHVMAKVTSTSLHRRFADHHTNSQQHREHRTKISTVEMYWIGSTLDLHEQIWHQIVTSPGRFSTVVDVRFSATLTMRQTGFPATVWRWQETQVSTITTVSTKTEFVCFQYSATQRAIIW